MAKATRNHAAMGDLATGKTPAASGEDVGVGMPSADIATPAPYGDDDSIVQKRLSNAANATVIRVLAQATIMVYSSYQFVSSYGAYTDAFKP
jgi:hypothetical protein